MFLTKPHLTCFKNIFIFEFPPANKPNFTFYGCFSMIPPTTVSFIPAFPHNRDRVRFCSKIISKMSLCESDIFEFKNVTCESEIVIINFKIKNDSMYARKCQIHF